MLKIPREIEIDLMHLLRVKRFEKLWYVTVVIMNGMVYEKESVNFTYYSEITCGTSHLFLEKVIF